MGKMLQRWLILKDITGQLQLKIRQMKTRKEIKNLIEDNWIMLSLSNSKLVNKPKQASLKATDDVTLAKNAYDDMGKNMKILFEAASIIRKAVISCKKWAIKCSLKKDNINGVVSDKIDGVVVSTENG